MPKASTKPEATETTVNGEEGPSDPAATTGMEPQGAPALPYLG